MKKTIGVLGLTLTMLTMLALPASAGAARTRGEFNKFSAGLTDPNYAAITGHAQMVRTGSDSTIVTIHLEGLLPNTTYDSHVHAQACSVGAAGGHYKIDQSVAGTIPSNEIWPGPITTDEFGVANGQAKAGDHRARADAVSVVVHRPGPTPNKIACADLA